MDLTNKNVTASNFHTVLIDGTPDMFCDKTARAEYWARVEAYLETVVLDVNIEGDAYANRDEDEDDHSDDVTIGEEPLAWG